MKEENLIIPKYFSQACLNFPNRVCLQIKKDSSWQRWTYKETEGFSRKISAFLIKEGFKKGDFVSLILENRPEWAVIYFGIMYAGLACVPIDAQLSQQEIKNLISDSGCRILFISYKIFLEKNIPEIKSQFKKIVVLDLDRENENLIDFSSLKYISLDNISWPLVLAEDTASLIYTSGTTAKPKGVLLSHNNLCANFMSIKKLNLILPSDNFLSILPLYHTYAFMVTLLSPLFLGGKITYCASFKPQDLAGVIKEARITILVGVPQLFSLIHKAIFEKIKKMPSFLKPFIFPVIKIKARRYFGKSLRFLVSGGARLKPKIARELSKLGFKLIEGYGLTETSPIVTLNPPQNLKFGSVGKSIPDVEIKILNPDIEGLGQVLIRGPNVMQGYFKQPQLTIQSTKDGWFYSGDLGYLDKDGYLFLKGREKEIIVLSSGKNIYPEELEEYYSKSPYIKELCVLYKEEKVFGYLKDSLYAVIVPNLEYFKLMKEVNIRQKIRWDLETLSKKLAPYQRIMGFTLTQEELPRTVLRKIKRYAVREKYLLPPCAQDGGLQGKPQELQITKQAVSREDIKILEKDMSQKIIRYVASQVNRPINLDSHLELDLGIDSLSRVELGLGLEAILQVKIPDELLYNVSSMRDVIINLEKLIEDANRTALDEVKEKGWSEILKDLPPKEILVKLKIDFGFLDRLLTWLFKSIFLFIFKLFWFLRIEGKSHLSGRGPYLICPNHASYLDGLFVFSCLSFKTAMNTYFLGYQRIFEHPLLGWMNKIGRMLSVDTNTHLAEAMQVVSYVLSHKKIVCIFPEGMRSIDTELKEFKKGVGILIKELNIPVVPVYIQGSHWSWPRGNRIPHFYPVKVIFGRSLYAKQLGDNYEMIAQRLKEEVLKLIPQNANL